MKPSGNKTVDRYNYQRGYLKELPYDEPIDRYLRSKREIIDIFEAKRQEELLKKQEKEYQKKLEKQIEKELENKIDKVLDDLLKNFNK